MKMIIDDLGVPRFTNQDIVKLIYEGNGDKLSKILVEPNRDTELYNEYIEKIGVDLTPLKTYQALPYEQKQFDDVLQSEWFMPDEYKNLDIYRYLEEKCATPEEVKRVDEEYTEYEKRGLLNRSPSFKNNLFFVNNSLPVEVNTKIGSMSLLIYA